MYEISGEGKDIFRKKKKKRLAALELYKGVYAYGKKISKNGS